MNIFHEQGPIYSVDTSTIRKIDNNFKDPKVEKMILSLIGTDRFKCIEAVSAELKKRTYEQPNWYQKYKTSIEISINQEIMEKSIAIDAEYPKLKRNREESADPFIIGLAKYFLDQKKNCIVVTEEKPDKQPQVIKKIPNVCDLEKIDWIDYDKLVAKN